jgi:Holliday junction resolvase RusA-like endonuclease
LSDPIVIVEAQGLLPRLNRKFNATSIGGKARLFMAKDYRERFDSLVLQFRVAAYGPPIDHFVDAKITVAMSKRTDTDAPIKAVLDALEKSGVIVNDRKIRSIDIHRLYRADESVKVELYHITE